MSQKSVNIDICGVLYSCNIRISVRARYIRLQYSPASGLELVMPSGISSSEAERFIFSKADWIKKNVGNNGKATHKSAKLKYQGRSLEVREQGTIKGRIYRVEAVDNNFLVYRPEGGNTEAHKIFDMWLRQKAKSYLPGRVKELADRFGFRFNKVSIRDQKTRWGSCSRRRNLSFNYRLMNHRPEVIDYVIVHELCHLREMNHSDRFWIHVAQILPDYKALRRELKETL